MPGATAQNSSSVHFIKDFVHCRIFLLILSALLLIITGMPNAGRRRCNGVKVLTTDGNEGHIISCAPNCTDQNCIWRKLPLSDQQPSRNLTLIWSPINQPKGQYYCVDEDDIPVEELLILSETNPTCQECFSVDLCATQNDLEFQLAFEISINHSLLHIQPLCDLITDHTTTSIRLGNLITFLKEPNISYKIECALCEGSQKTLSYYFEQQQFEHARPCSMNRPEISTTTPESVILTSITPTRTSLTSVTSTMVSTSDMNPTATSTPEPDDKSDDLSGGTIAAIVIGIIIIIIAIICVTVACALCCYRNRQK